LNVAPLARAVKNLAPHSALRLAALPSPTEHAELADAIAPKSRRPEPQMITIDLDDKVTLITGAS
jgi:hypothetical protein